MAGAQQVVGYKTRAYEVGCLNGVVTWKSIYTCDPKAGPVQGSGTDTQEVSFFWQDTATGQTVIDWATAVASWKPGPCAEASSIGVGVITNPDDPAAVDVPVVATQAPDGTVTFTSLVDGSTVTPAAGEEFRLNPHAEVSETFGCIKDAAGNTVRTAQLVVVRDEDGEEASRAIINPADGSTIALAAGEVFGPCSGGLPSSDNCGCLVDLTNGTTRPARQEIPRNPDSGLLDWGAVTYADPTTGAEITPVATEVFQCGSCPELINCP